MQTLRSFLNNKTGGNVIKRYASRAIIIAANKSQDEVAELILKNGVDVNARGPEQNATVVHYAIANGDIKMLKFLIKYGANLSLKINYPYDAPGTEPSETALMLAASEGNFQMVKLLLESGLNVNEKDCTGNSTLSVASLNGRTEIVELLLKKGADVNSKDAYGWTPLHFSVVNGSLSVVKLLLGHGANVSAKASFIDVRQFNSTPFSPFMLASLIGNKEIAEEFLKNGADINERGGFHNGTAVHHAITAGDVELLKLLIKYRADLSAKVDYRDPPGTEPSETALILATWNGNTEYISEAAFG